MSGRYSILEPAVASDIPIQPQAGAPTSGRYSVVASDPSAAFLPGLLQGATLEWGDELAGLLGYDKEAYRAYMKKAADLSPASYNTGKLAGAIGTSFLPGALILRGAKGAQTLGQIAKQGAVLGGGLGAVEALGESESGDPSQAAAKTMLGAGAGAAAGAVLPPIAYGLLAGVRGGGRFLADAARGDSSANALRKTEEALRRQGTEAGDLSARLVADARPAVQGANPDVLADVLRGLQEGRTATEVAELVNKSYGLKLTGPQVGVMSAGFDRANPVPRDLLRLSEEVGGGEAGRSGLTNLMQGVATLPGKGREIALRNMGATMEAAPERMAQRLSGEMGDLNFRRAMATREATRRAEANAAYGAARQADEGAGVPGVMEAELEPVLTGYALRAQRMGGETGSKIAQGVEIMSGARPGSTEFGINTIERFHEARKTLDQLIRQVNTGANPDWNAGRILREMRNELNGRVYARNSAFQAADRQFATNMAREEAMRLGRQMSLRSGEAQDEVLAAMRQLESRHPTNAGELRDRFMQGTLRRMADEIEISGGVPARWVQPLTGGIRPAPRAALQEALGAPLPGAAIAGRTNAATGAVGGQPVPYGPGRETAQGVTQILGDEARLKKIFTDVWGNSKTAERLAAQEDLRALPGIAAEMATGGIGGLKNAITKRLMMAMTERNAEQIARIVTETDPRVLYLALNDIQRMAPKIKAGERVMAAPSLALGAGAGQVMTGR